jgi:hypothetical protein
LLLDTFDGLPTHALIVHFTAVALPTAAITGIIVALWPRARRRYGVLVGLVTVAAYIAVPLSVHSGEHLYARQSARFGPADATEAGLMQVHENLALAMHKWTVLLLIGVVLVVLPPVIIRWDRGRGRNRVLAPVGAGAPIPGDGTAAARAPGLAGRLELAEADAPAWQLPVMVVGILLTVVGGIMTLIMVFRVGEAGARAAWVHIDVPTQSQTN